MSVTIKCETCGAPREVRPAIALRGARYCSNRCRAASTRKTPPEPLDVGEPERWRLINRRTLHPYEVSDLGRVRSLIRGKHHVLTPRRLPTGYLVVMLRVNGKQSYPSIHRLVAEAFIPQTGPVVRHKDANRANNRASNLCWGTVSDNAYDTVAHGHNKAANKTHCNYGHEFTPENTIIRKGSWRNDHRRCRTCTNANERKNWRLRREQRELHLSIEG